MASGSRSSSTASAGPSRPGRGGVQAPSALVWVHGDEALLVQEALDEVRSTWRDEGFAEREIIEVDRQFKPQSLQATVRERSLFASRRRIELRLGNKPGKDLGQVLADLLPDLDADTRLLVQSPRLDRQTTTQAWFVALERGARIRAIAGIDRARLPAWIGERLGRQNQQADADTLTLMADRVEGNLLAAHQEIQKLGLLCPPGPLDAATVRAAVLDVARFDLDDVTQAMLAGDCGRALRSLDGLQQEGVAEPLVLWGLSETTRSLDRLLRGRQAGEPVARLMRELKIFGPRERLFEQALRRADLAVVAPRLGRALQQAAAADRIVKGLARGDAWAAMRGVVISVAGGPVLEAGDPLEVPR